MINFSRWMNVLKDWLSDPAVGKIFSAFLVLIIIFVVSILLRRFVVRRIPDSTTRYRVRKVIVFSSYLIGIITLAAIFSEGLRSFTVAFGVAGAGVAFALQEVIMSIAGWLTLSFGRYYKVGDRINLGGTLGDVNDIGILRTTMMECGSWVQADLYNGKIVRIANSFVFKQPVYNYSGDFAFLWDEITIPVKYGSDYRMARRIIEKAGNDLVGTYSSQYENAWKQISKRFFIETQSLDPAVTITANDRWVEFTLRYIVEYRQRRVTKDKLFWRILEDIDKSQEAVGIAAATLNIEKLAVSKIPPLDVNISTEK